MFRGIGAFLALGFALSAHAAIFGEDDRVAIVPNSAHSISARSTAIAVLNVSLTWNATQGFTLQAEHMSDLLCKEERFVNDPSMSYSCSGFLVAPDIMVTAGHCFVNSGEVEHEKAGYCAIYSFLFDYNSNAAGETQTENLKSDRLYHCKEVLYAINGANAKEDDFAIVQLDRPVLDRAPLALSTLPLSVGEKVTMIGYPLGTPAKFTGPAPVVTDDSTNHSVLTRLNAFDGNSGSAVFNAAGKVVGILISGRPGEAFVSDPVKKCSHINHCYADGSHCQVEDFADATAAANGSDVQRIKPVLEKLSELSQIAEVSR